MSHAITVTIDGEDVRVDGRDVAAATGLRGEPDERQWLLAAEAYVEQHPRRGQRVADAQRLALLRRLAAGPATTEELLAAMREAGWVGSSDLENRLRDLRGVGQRGAGRTVVVEVERTDDRYRLTAPFPRLEPQQERALGFAKALVAQQASPLAARAVQTLDGVFPGIARHTGQHDAATMTASARHLDAFEQAREEQRPVRITYWSMNSGREKAYLVVPVDYVPSGPSLKAICVVVDDDGRRESERQFALDRLRSVTATDLDPLPAEDLELERDVLHLEVTDALYRIMTDRNQFGIREASAEQVDTDVWRVQGTFPTVLGWDVMEQLCAWSGSVVVHEPLWLVHAVCRRARAALRAMEEGVMELVKPESWRDFASLEDAVWPDEEPPDAPAGPRRLAPPPRRATSAGR